MPFLTPTQTCQPSRFWRDSPAFLPDVPRPAKSWKCPAFCTKSDFVVVARAQFVTRAPTLMQITKLNVITEIPFDFSQKYQTDRGRIAVLSVFWNAIDFCRLYTSKKNLNANRPAFCRQVPLFTRNVPLKTFSRLAGLPTTHSHRRWASPSVPTSNEPKPVSQQVVLNQSFPSLRQNALLCYRAWSALNTPRELSLPHSYPINRRKLCCSSTV